jgi:drug/metabolite transporter (DMT)-like permease
MSVITHCGYYLGLSAAYRSGDMGQVYPIARGTAPLMTAVGGALLVGENFSLLGWAGILALVSGVFLLSMRGGAELAHLNRRAVAFALMTAVTISGYSLVDGIGARTAGNAHSYAVWLFVIDGAFITGFALVMRGTAAIPAMAVYWKSGLVGGVLSLVAYWIVIWAMTVAPIAMVAALRETSVLFAAGIAGRVPEGAVARDAHHRGGHDRLRDGVDQAAIALRWTRTLRRDRLAVRHRLRGSLALAQPAVAQLARDLEDRVGDRGRGAR